MLLVTQPLSQSDSAVSQLWLHYDSTVTHAMTSLDVMMTSQVWAVFWALLGPLALGPLALWCDGKLANTCKLEASLQPGLLHCL